MTAQKIRNSLYTHTKGVINQAIPLEYGIRAVQLANPDELQELANIDREIRECWHQLGLTDADIDGDELMDFAWDTIQVGYPLARRFGQFYHGGFIATVNKGLTSMHDTFCEKVRHLRIPAMQYFRICDLLHGNNILYLLNAVASRLKKAGEYEVNKPEDGISMKEFIRKIRRPIHIHPGFQYVAKEEEHDGRRVEHFGFVLDTKIKLSLPDLKRQIREFLYQYATRRALSHPGLVQDQLANELVKEFMSQELKNQTNKEQVTRVDGFISVLSGLYCWDQYQHLRQQKVKSALEHAIADTQKIYPTQVRAVSDEAIKKNYASVNRKIRKIRFSG